MEKPEDSPFAGLMSVLPSSDNCASEHVRSNKPVPSEGHISDSEDEGICHGSDEKGDTDSTDGISVDVPVSGDFVMLPPLVSDCQAYCTADVCTLLSHWLVML